MKKTYSIGCIPVAILNKKGKILGWKSGMNLTKKEYESIKKFQKEHQYLTEESLKNPEKIKELKQLFA